MANITETTVVRLQVKQLHNNTGQIPELPGNPRFIKDEKYKRLLNSMREGDLTGVLPVKVYQYDGKWVVLGGNMRIRAMKELGINDVSCIVIPAETDTATLRKIVLLDNSTFGDWDWDLLANDWDMEDLEMAAIDIPTDWGAQEAENDEQEEIERKRKEFEDRIKAGEISEEDEEYQEFLEKFKLKKTTDDCYTPPVVYEAIADWVANEYGLKKSKFMRPFYPGGDYQKEKYPEDAVVVDNPPFSILAQILNFYNEKGIKFFLFAPHLTLFSSSSSSSTALVTGVSITYENGANVATSFLTNLEPRTIRFRSCPTLYQTVKAANDENLKQQRKELPKYAYDWHVVTSAMVAPFSRLGIDFVVPVSESFAISQLDAQKDSGKGIFGKGYLISDRLYAEREKAEREKAERWNLSERERALVMKMSSEQINAD